jgi:hypothetical protein
MGIKTLNKIRREPGNSWTFADFAICFCSATNTDVQRLDQSRSLREAHFGPQDQKLLPERGPKTSSAALESGYHGAQTI